MSFFSKYKVKVQYIKLDIIARDISNIHASVASPYVIPKRQLTTVRGLMYDNPKKAVREMKKAKKMFLAESRVASEYNRYADIIDESKDDRLLLLRTEYLNAIHEGDYKGARKILEKVSVSPEIVEPRPRLVINTERTTATSAILTATNELDSNLLITSFNILSDSDIVSDVHGTMIIQGKERRRITLTSEKGIQYPVKVAITYTVGNEDRKLSYTIYGI